MKQSFVKISKITKPPYSDIWIYPKGTRAQVKSRIKELKALGVESISFQGELQVGTISLLGKGYVGVVVLGKIGRKKVAVKIRRNDSPRKNLKKEAELLGITNQSDVGPKLVNFSKNFLVMEYLEGQKIGEKLINKMKEISKSKGWNLVRWITRDDNVRAKSLYDRVAKKTNWNVYEL